MYSITKIYTSFSVHAKIDGCQTNLLYIYSHTHTHTHTHTHLAAALSRDRACLLRPASCHAQVLTLHALLVQKYKY